MVDPGFIYVIPPYLLNTCVGQELYQELCWLDPQLAAKNFFPSESSCYKFRLPRDLSQDPHSFCDDPRINDQIRARLKEKFSALGILGSSPSETLGDEYLFELYEIFKDRLIPGKKENERISEGEDTLNDMVYASINSGSAQESSVSVEPHAQVQKSMFSLPRYGEFIYKSCYKDINSSSLANSPLDKLIAWARDKKEHKYSFLPYLMVGGKNFFLSPLPMYWTPLSAGIHLDLLDGQLNLISDIENGYSILRLRRSRSENPDKTPTPKKRFYNFISNNEIKEKTGIFYYEVSVEQTATRSTEYDPIIQANDPSLSSGSSLFFNMGFTKRSIKFDKIPSNTGPLSATSLIIDLKEVQADICLHNSSPVGSTLDEDTVNFLGSEPGVSFDGSLAISFNNSCSYAYMKRSDANFRTSSLNLNRRFSQLNRHSSADQDSSKLEIDAPFNTYSHFEAEEKKAFQTDTVGFGVNFIERTLFVTLNGVLVKTIKELDITASNRYQDSLFGQGVELGPLYPMIGFRLAGFSKISATGDMPESKIVTNFGMKSFQFNIEGYVQNLKKSQTALLRSVINDELNTVNDTSNTAIYKIEKAVHDIKNDPAILNDFIGGYLVQEGFLKTFESFKSDLHDLSKNVRQEEDEEMEEFDIQQPIDENFVLTKALQRQQLRKSILERRYSEAIEILHIEFSNLDKLELFVFELELLQYIDLLRNIYDSKFGCQGEQVLMSKHQESIMYKQALYLGKCLIEKSDEASINALLELSSVLLLNEKDGIKELSQANRLFERDANDIKILATMINSEILKEQGFTKESKLEKMVTYVGDNVRRLSSENKNPFRLLNFERDYLSI